MNMNMQALLTLLTCLTSLENIKAQHCPRKLELNCTVESKLQDSHCNQVLKRLDVSSCTAQQIGKIHSFLPKLSALWVLIISNNRIEDLPKYTFSKNLNLKFLDISNNRIEDLPRYIFSENLHLKYLNLSHNLLTKIDPDVFYNLPSLEKLILSHNKLQSLNLASLYFRNQLKYLDLSHNQIELADIGSGIFPNLEELDLSYNNISTYSPNNGIRNNFNRLRTLTLKHNQISGVIPHEACFALRKNITVDLSHNNIDRFDLRYRGIDILDSQYLDFPLKTTTTFIVHNNSLACDCYAEMMREAKGRFVFDDFLCPDNSSLMARSLDSLVCPVPDYPGMQNYSSCPASCHCYYSHAQLTVNCTARNLQHFPALSSLPRSQVEDSIILLLADNEIRELSQNLTGINIIHLDLRNNRITNIERTKLPAKLVTFSISSNPISCSCNMMDFYLSSLPMSDDTETTICIYGNISVGLNLFELVCSWEIFIYFGILSICVSIPILLMYFRFKPRGMKEFDYDVFISYSHHDAYFAENVLYPGLLNYHIKCCIHTLHWQVGETISKQIVDSVKRSRKTLIVLSENYIQSNWTKLEFQAAKNLTKKDNIERLIVVMAEKLSENQPLDSEFESHIRNNKSISIEDEQFWSKLRKKLS